MLRIYYASCRKCFEISLESQRETNTTVILVRVETNQKMYIEVRRYLSQMYILQQSSKHLTSQLLIIL